MLSLSIGQRPAAPGLVRLDGDSAHSSQSLLTLQCKEMTHRLHPRTVLHASDQPTFYMFLRIGWISVILIC
jgi:hypothetical protein